MPATEIVTVLFTDLVGSTELFQRLGDDAAEKVRRKHFQLLREAVERRGGHEVKNLGDGLMVIFSSAVDALGCAVAIQEAVGEHNQGAKGPAFSVRVGLQVGEPIRDEDDYFGTPVILAKRLCDAARGGQILASQLVAGLAGSRGGFRFRSVGRLKLKGIAQAVPAVEVAWEPQEAVRHARRPATPKRRPAAARGPKLVGRDAELAALEHELAAVASGIRCVLVLGEAGVGKTRLANELVARHAADVLTLAARAFALGEATAFGLWSEALERHLVGLTADEVVELCGGFLDDLAAVLHSVALVRGSAPEREPPRRRLLDGLATVLRSLAKTSPMIVVLDDVHLADASSWEALGYLPRQLSEAPILVLATARPAELAEQTAASPVLFSLEQDGVLERLSLGPLDAQGIAALAEAVLGDVPSPALCGWLTDRSRGNALFAHGLLRALLEEGGDLSSPVLRRLPENLADRVRTRLAELDPAAVETLEVLATVGRQSELGELARLTARPLEELEVVLAHLTRSRLALEEERGHELLYENGHPLVAEAIYQNIGGLRRRRLHRTIASSLHVEGRLSEAASHFARSGEVGDPEAIGVLRDALRQAEEREAYHEALTILGALVELLPTGDERWLEVADAMSWDAEWVVDRRAGIHAAMGIRALRNIDSLLAHVADPGRQAQVNSRLANFLAYGTGELDEAEASCRKALRLFEQAGDRTGALWAALDLAFIVGVKGDPAGWETGARRVFEAAEQTGEGSLSMEASWGEGCAAFFQGRFLEGEQAFQRSLSIARQTGKRYAIAFRLESLAVLAVLEGRAEEAAAFVAEMRTMYPERAGGLVPEMELFRQWILGNFEAALGSPLQALSRSPGAMSKTRAFTMAAAALAAAEGGHLGPAREYLTKAQAAYEEGDWFFYLQYCAQAEGVLTFREGRQSEGLVGLRQAAKTILALGILPCAAFAFVDLADFAAHAREPDIAIEASVELAAIAKTVDRNLYRALAAIGAAWARLARQDQTQAAEAAEQAVRLLSEMGYPGFFGRALDVLGRSLVPSDRAGAVKALEEAAEIFGACGAHWRKERAIEALRSLRGRGEKAAAALLGPGSLTRREREVARLAIQGLTAKEIAKELILGPRTVEGHLANVYAKLGVRSKVELARRASELGT